MFKKKNLENKNKQSGFSLMELLVVIAILGIILSTSLFSYDNFGKDVELENSVYSLALAIREAQTYGVNKKSREGVADPKDFGQDYGYGMYFTDISLGTDWNSKKFILFEDKGVVPNEIFNSGAGTVCPLDGECYSKISLTKGNYISKIWVKSVGGWSDASHNVNIFFQRPNPDAKIKIGVNSYERTCILVSDPSGKYSRSVEVGVAGDITIKKDCNY